MQNILMPTLLILLLFTVSGCVSLGNAKDGTAIDSIARVSYGGWIWKTWCVQLTNDHPIEGNTQCYGIDKVVPSLVEKIQAYAGTGEKVKLYYQSKFFVFAWDYSDAEVIYNVEGVVS